MSDDLELAASLVREAGQLACRLRTEGLSVATKTNPSDIVTNADRAAESLIVSRLLAERPDDGIVGEEGAAHPSKSGRTWVIDPVDGTFNFAAGLTWWCSAIALLDQDDLILGAVYHPHDDLLYLGGPELMPTRNGEPILPILDRGLAESAVATYLHPPFYESAVGAAFARAVAGAATLRMLGSGTLDQMAIAEGRFGALFQHSVADWDWLPGSAIVRGLGGAALQVEAAGVTWSIAGAPTAVAQIHAALTAP